LRISSFAIDKSFRRPVQSLIVFSLATNLLLLAAPIHMLQVYDRVLSSKSIETLVYLTAIVLIAMAVYGVAEAVRGKLAQRISNQFTVEYAEKVFDSLVNDKKQDKDPNAVLRDINTVRTFLAGRQFVNLFDLPFFPLFLFLMFLLHFTLGFVALVGVILMLSIAFLNNKVTSKAQSASTEAKNQASSFSLAVMRRTQDIRAMGLLPAIMERWGTKTAASLEMADDAAAYTSIFFGLSKAIRQSLQIISMAWGAFLVLGGDMSGGMIFAASMLLGKTLMPVEQLIGGWSALTAARTAYSSVVEIAERSSNGVEPMQLPAPKGHLLVENLVFQPNQTKEQKPILDDVSFNLEPGQLLAISGASGSGKSTLAKMIVGAMVPTSGTVRLDNFDIEQWPSAQRGQAIGYVPQDIVLFPGTIAENIARLDISPSDDKIIAAANLAGVHEMIAGLPDGYATEIGTVTANLSGGQRQRIALARAYYSQPRILVLDEPNAHLDKDSEKILMNSLQMSRQAGVAIIIISHRSAILKIADFLMVIEAGKIKSFSSKSGQPAANRGMTDPTSQTGQTGQAGQNSVQRPQTVPDEPLAAQPGTVPPPMPDALVEKLRAMGLKAEAAPTKQVVL